MAISVSRRGPQATKFVIFVRHRSTDDANDRR
jgi:hypothetical protein